MTRCWSSSNGPLVPKSADGVHRITHRDGLQRTPGRDPVLKAGWTQPKNAVERREGMAAEMDVMCGTVLCDRREMCKFTIAARWVWWPKPRPQGEPPGDYRAPSAAFVLFFFFCPKRHHFSANQWRTAAWPVPPNPQKAVLHPSLYSPRRLH